jgi:predicted transcriptional regulator
MDKYDSLILEIIQEYRKKATDKSRIRLRHLETAYWKRIEAESDLNLGQGRVGERITNLYLAGLIENKDGYGLTRKGRSKLESRRAEV